MSILKNISFNVKAGETVAIVGPTGAGKTTIVALLQRFYDVQTGRGSIKIDGTDIRNVTRNSVVSQMSMVLQEPYLFSGTIAENIKYNHIDLSHEQAISAAKSVGAHEFIKDLPNGYYTEVAERGVNLSLGQRQLISFARAIAANPAILILDEATASIDSISEMMIQKAMQRVLKGRTAIVIAHRLSTIRGSDKILVVNDGEINQSGTHEELLQNPGIYSKLYQMNYEAFEDQPA
jgi:ATP-binding cassette subfamily B multidrug efflux pump